MTRARPEHHIGLWPAPVGLLLAFVMLSACGLVARDEVWRVASPDGLVDAVLVEVNGGASTSFGYEVHVVHAGRPPKAQVAWLYDAHRSAQAYGANLRWPDNNTLLIAYLEADEQALDRPSVTVAGRRVGIQLRSGITDPSAPAGGMLYNLKQVRGGDQR